MNITTARQRIFPHRIRARAASVQDEPNPTRLRPWIGLVLFAIVTVFAARAASTAIAMSLTYDEDTHLARGLYGWSTGQDARFWMLGTPAAPHLLDALPSYCALRWAGKLPARPSFPECERLVRSGEPLAVIPARLAGIIWGIGLIVLVFLGVALSRGPAQGLWAAGLLSLVPELIAHSAVAGADIPSAMAGLLCVIVLGRFAQNPTNGRWLSVALAVGFAWAIRHSAIVLIAVAAITHFVSTLSAMRCRGGRSWLIAFGRSALATATLVAIAFPVLWAADGFGLVTRSELLRQKVDRSMPTTTSFPADEAAIFPNSMASLLTQVHHQNEGHPAYFCGARRLQGWRTYFPTALSLKTPIGLILLIIIAAARFLPETRFEKIALLLLAVTWITLFRSRVDIGVRYAVITYPLLVPFIARLFDPRSLRDRIWSPIVAVALVAFAVASISAHPRYLSYFNEIGGGPSWGFWYLSDSNVDWGQDHAALVAALEKRGIAEATTAVFSPGSLIDSRVRLIDIAASQSPAIRATPTRWIPQEKGGLLSVPTRYIAVSATRLHRVYTNDDLYWLFTRRLVERIGDSIFLFDMDTPAVR
jgi:hypothetical protein